MSTVITVENLGKKYFLSHQVKQEPYVALRDVIAVTCKSLGGKVLFPFSHRSTSPDLQSPNVEEFWALKDVSFEVQQGDRIGIIGRNGAGKSTLLKILSRITEPTTGFIKIKGRVASLLEVGTGFHPELTGRENIYLNGAILGMGRAEIKKKFDEIVDFAEIDKFLDTPVKRYSSGMYVRLAFAVAAHLEPDILVVDEVLAVGDAQFQKKCLGKMEEVGREGRTVLFVSHNISAINSLCTRGVLLKQGQLELDGDTNAVTDSYLAGLGSEYSDQTGHFNLHNRHNPYLNGLPVIVGVSVYDHHDRLSNTVTIGRPAKIRLELENIPNVKHLDFGIGFYTPEGSRITTAATWAQRPETMHCRGGTRSAIFVLEKVPFTAGNIVLSPSVANMKHGMIYDHAEMTCNLHVVEDELSNREKKFSRVFGVVELEGKWLFEE